MRALDLVATNLCKNPEKLEKALGEVGKIDRQAVDIKPEFHCAGDADYVRARKGPKRAGQ